MLHLPKKPEIEPLDDERWDRIEGEIFAKLDEGRLPAKPTPRFSLRARPRASWMVLAVASGAAAAAAIALALRTPAPNGGPSRIVTHGDASHVDLASASLDLSPDSEVVVNGDDDRGVVLVLDRGSVTCDVAPRRDRPPFVVQAGSVQVKVVGTHFRVRRDGESAEVDVTKGIVEVTAGGDVTAVHPGEHWAPAPSSAHGSAPSPSTSSEPEPEIAPSSATNAEPAPAPHAPVKAKSPQEMFEAATSLEAKKPDQALAMYREIARGSGPWAANALFAEGRLYADMGRNAEARRLLNEYAARFPRGANVDDARQLLARLPP